MEIKKEEGKIVLGFTKEEMKKMEANSVDLEKTSEGFKKYSPWKL